MSDSKHGGLAEVETIENVAVAVTPDDREEFGTSIHTRTILAVLVRHAAFKR